MGELHRPVLTCVANPLVRYCSIDDAIESDMQLVILLSMG